MALLKEGLPAKKELTFTGKFAAVLSTCFGRRVVIGNTPADALTALITSKDEHLNFHADIQTPPCQIDLGSEVSGVCVNEANKVKLIPL